MADTFEGLEKLDDLRGYLKASNADGLHILEATAPWCGQCKAIAPFVKKLRAKYSDAHFYYYNTDEAGDISQELGANLMPSFHIFKDGELKDTVTGAKAKQLEDAIAKLYDGKVEAD